MPPKFVQVGPPLQGRPLQAPPILASGTIVKRITLEEYNAQRRAESGQMLPMAPQPPIALPQTHVFHQVPPATIQFAPARHVQFVNQNTSRVPIQIPVPTAPTFHRSLPPEGPHNPIHGTIIENLSRMSIAKFSDPNPNTSEPPAKASIQDSKETGSPEPKTPASHSQSQPPKPESPSSLIFDEDTQSSQKSALATPFVGPGIPVAVPVEMLKSSIIIEKQVANPFRSSSDLGDQRDPGLPLRPAVLQHQAAVVKTEVLEMREKNQALAKFVAGRGVSSPGQLIADPDSFPNRDGSEAPILRELRAQIEQLKGQLDSQTQAVEEAQRENRRLKEKLTLQRQEMGEFREQVVRGQAKDAQGLRTQLAELQAANRELESDAAEFERKYRQSLAENVNLKNELMRLRTETEDLRRDNSHWKAKFQEAEGEVQAKSALEERVALLNSQLTQEKEARESLSRSNTQKENEARLEEENERLRNMVTDLNAENENFHKTLSQSASNFEKFAEKLRSQVAANEALGAEKQKLEDQLAKLNEEVEDLRRVAARRSAEEEDGRSSRENPKTEKISNLIFESLGDELDQNNGAAAHEMEILQQEMAMMGEQIMLRDHKIQKLRIERFEAMMRLAFSLSEVERLRNRHIPF